MAKHLDPVEAVTTVLDRFTGIADATESAKKVVQLLGPTFAATGVGVLLGTPAFPIVLAAVLAASGTYSQWRQAKSDATRLRVAKHAFDAVGEAYRTAARIAQEKGLLSRPELADEPNNWMLVIRALIEIEGARTREDDIVNLQAYFDWYAGWIEPKFGGLEADLGHVLDILHVRRKDCDLFVSQPKGAVLTLDLQRPQASEGGSGLLFSDARVTLLGRDKELAALRKFRDEGGLFRFLVVSGPGGVGKSRLAWEFCWQSLFDGWQAGFVRSVSEGTFDWGSWKPERDTLLVVDYIFAKDRELWKRILTQLTRLDGDKNVRVLILERTADAAAWEWLVGNETLGVQYGAKGKGRGWRRRNESGALELKTLRLRGLRSGDLTKLFEACFKADGISLNARSTAYRYREQVDEVGRPLFAMLAARAFVRATAGSQTLAWSLGAIIDQVLSDLIESWRRARIDVPHLRLLALATIVGGLELQGGALDALLASSIKDLLPSENEMNEGSLRHLAAYSDDWHPNECFLPPLQPDPLGEAFVLALMNGTIDGQLNESGMREHRLRTAERLWEFAEAEARAKDCTIVRNAKALQDFVQRCLQDFPAASMTGLRSLQSLNLSHAWFEDKQIESLRSLPQLQHLNLYGTFITNKGLESLKGLIQLKSLDLEATGVTDKGLENLRSLSQLRDLNLSYTGVTDVGLESLKGLIHLESLSLWNTAVTDKGLENLTGLSQLQVLDLPFTRVTGRGLGSLKGLNQLQVLDLSCTRVTDEGLESLRGLLQLESLSLWNTKVTDKGLENIKDLPQLQVLDLSCTKVTDEGLESLKDLVQLKSLSLWETAVTDKGAESLKGFAQLQFLELQGTAVTNGALESLRQSLPRCDVSR